jgi:hypothetical protein
MRYIQLYESFLDRKKKTIEEIAKTFYTDEKPNLTPKECLEEFGKSYDIDLLDERIKPYLYNNKIIGYIYPNVKKIILWMYLKKGDTQTAHLKPNSLQGIKERHLLLCSYEGRMEVLRDISAIEDVVSNSSRNMANGLFELLKWWSSQNPYHWENDPEITF